MLENPNSVHKILPKCGVDDMSIWDVLIGEIMTSFWE